jgi:hypothetical protein
MMDHCPQHGLCFYCLISPDLTQGGRGTLPRIVKIEHDGYIGPLVTVSAEFASENKVEGDTIGLLIAHTWIPRLQSICTKCYSMRWPELLTEDAPGSS